MEDYYRSQKEALNTELNLDGLVASTEQMWENTQPPVVKHRRNFSFPNITSVKQGVFVLEFLGNGLSARAVIRKGKLLLLERITLAGHCFTLLDEDQVVCKPDLNENSNINKNKTQNRNTPTKTGMWVGDKWHAADSDG